ncbi:MAG: type II toxin-antitoxin system YafQ family toxin [Puniceicoccaceae bacterium]
MFGRAGSRKTSGSFYSSKKDVDRLGLVIQTFQRQEPLRECNRDHTLTGNYIGYRACNISPDWLLIYQKTETELILVRTGSRRDLFR